jgi:hypothetical protein
MTGYVATFQKKDGSMRTMKFLKLNDLPSEFLAGKVKGVQQHSLSEGMELVWDIDEKGFRVFNRNKVVDKILEFEYTFNQ